MIWQSNLVEFIMPNVDCYFLNPDIAAKSQHFLASSMQLFGFICSQLSWKRYETQVKYYLGLLKKVGLPKYIG